MNQEGIVLETDVLVVGGGTAGCLAALSAARENVKVLVLESESALGGVATRAGIHRYYYGSPGGMQEEIDRRTEEVGRLLGGSTMGFHPEARRITLSRLCEEAGITVVLNSIVYEVLLEGRQVLGVRASTEEGKLTVRAAVTIDATGNGNAVKLAGGAMSYGREQDGVYHNYSLVPRRIRDGQIGYDNLDAGWVDPYDPWDVSRAFLHGRAWIGQAYREGLHYYGISSALGYREGGLIEGRGRLTIDHYMEDASLPDVIARSYSHLDNHGFDTGNESDFSQLWISILGLFARGLWCDIPYGSLLPSGLEGIMVGCRALSVDRDVSMGVRMQKDMHKVGEAAGLAAAMSVKAGAPPSRVDILELQRRLLERGVLEADDLNRTESRNLGFRQGPLAGKTVPPERAGAYVEPLISYFGGEEQWKAVWLLAKRVKPEAAAGPLRRALEQGSPASRLCAAMVLTMHGGKDAEAFLLELLAARERTRLTDHPKCLPFWIAALILLRMMKSSAAVNEAVQLLEEPLTSVEAVFALTYLSQAASPLSDVRKRAVAEAVKRFAARPGLGDDYKMHGSRSESLRWSLELHAAEVLAVCGDSGYRKLLEPYTTDLRGYARSAARELIRRLPQREAAAVTGVAADAPDEIGAGELRPVDYDVAVLGGGIAGVVCAAALSRAGARVLLVETSSALLTEVTRSRLTRWPQPPGLARGGAAAALTACLAEAGALREGEVEPVLAQLAADRFVREAGVTVLFEARCLEASMEVQGGGQMLQLVHKNGRLNICASRVVDCTPEASVLSLAPGMERRAAAPGEGRLVSTLVCAEPVSELRAELGAGQGKVAVRIRPSLHEKEAYLETAWHRPAGGKDGAAGGLAAVAEAVKRLREEGALPAQAALAYIADISWQLPDFIIDANASTPAAAGSRIAAVPDGRLLGAGLWQARVRERLEQAEKRQRDELAAAELLLAGEEAARVAWPESQEREG
ncbi:FAD dependent oxidoreductase [Paenibacillus sp. UNCCL117]|uniref:FAD-dependent oxidoreductase n=1 Tax=unclassified Paenibacillus TaxID=185978 RepID=UPI00088B308F|nr:MULTISPECIES: FAD-dependent oxidoreductase [unclassified Paenibacillus]SDD03104.1 FAD dependent oxidoreductase [Paenibacillus sp. cl123]SFW32371.1 FAD dependent oxidoreductase [Paenibacillus sp. UNCCL117]